MMNLTPSIKDLVLLIQLIHACKMPFPNHLYLINGFLENS